MAIPKALRGAAALGVLLRILSAGSRFVALFLVARYLTDADLGTFAVISSAVSVLVYVVGFDYYVFTTREIRYKPNTSGACVRDQLAFHAVGYSIAIVIWIFLILLDVFPYGFLLWLLILVPLEHLGQEVVRLCVAIDKPLAANAFAFLRAALWIFPLSLLFLAYPHMRALEMVWLLWALGGVIALVTAGVVLRTLDWRSVFLTPPDLASIRIGVKVAALFFLGTASGMLLEHFGRFYLLAMEGEVAVGVLFMYLSIGSLYQIVAHSGFIMHIYPSLLTAVANHDKETENNLVRRLNKAMQAFAAFASVTGLLLLHIIAFLTNKLQILQHRAAFFLVLGCTVLWLLSQGSHFLLYARKQDHAILVWTWLGALTTAAITLAYGPAYGLTAAAGGMFAGSSVMTAGKWWSANKSARPA